MHLLYLDDAGSVGNVHEQYLVLGGVCVFEAQSSWIARSLDRLEQNIDPANPHGVEFHASETFARRRKPWKGLSQDEARGTIKSVLDVLTNAYVGQVTDARREAEAQQMHQCEHMIGEAGRVGVRLSSGYRARHSDSPLPCPRVP